MQASSKKEKGTGIWNQALRTLKENIPVGCFSCWPGRHLLDSLYAGGRVNGCSSASGTPIRIRLNTGNGFMEEYWKIAATSHPMARSFSTSPANMVVLHSTPG